MPIANIIDRRKRPYRFYNVNAVVEAAWHDNSVKNSDRVDSAGNPGPDYAEREHLSLADAVAWANSFLYQVMLYIYDEDGGIYPVTSSCLSHLRTLHRNDYRLTVNANYSDCLRTSWRWKKRRSC